MFTAPNPRRILRGLQEVDELLRGSEGLEDFGVELFISKSDGIIEEGL
jgi:hypothetical protein